MEIRAIHTFEKAANNFDQIHFVRMLRGALKERERDPLRISYFNIEAAAKKVRLTLMITGTE